jgi:hypothetical protein
MATKTQTYEMISHAARIAAECPELSPHRVTSVVMDLQHMAASLHKRYEAACSYEWANTPAYERRTERMEAKAADLAPFQTMGRLTVEHQRDPRGWPLILKLNGVEIGRLG